jgi:hypothetical protein
MYYVVESRQACIRRLQSVELVRTELQQSYMFGLEQDRFENTVNMNWNANLDMLYVDARLVIVNSPFWRHLIF